VCIDILCGAIAYVSYIHSGSTSSNLLRAKSVEARNGFIYAKKILLKVSGIIGLIRKM
jgi:hypothetical protein